LALRDEFARVTDEHFDDVPLGRGQAHLACGGGYALGGEVDCEVVGLDDRLLLGWRRPPSPARSRASSSSIPKRFVT
jgi:hypothetical protein